MLLVTAVVGLSAIVAVYFSSRIAMGFGRDVRGAIFTTVQSFSQVEVNHFGPASLITRNTNDVQQVQQVIFMAMTIMVSAPILIVGGIIMALRTDVPLSGLLLVILPVMALVIGVTMIRLIPLFRTTQTKIDRINQVMRETLSGVRVIRAFVRTRHEEARFEIGQPRPVRRPAEGRPDLRDHAADDLRDLQPLDGRRPLVRGDAGRVRRPARSAT